MSLADYIAKIPMAYETITSWLGNGATPVDKDLAQARANVCLNCIMNRKSNPVVSAAMTPLRAVVQIKNEMKLRVDGEKKLGECSVCKCDLKTKIWVPLEHILGPMNYEEINELPDWCWIKVASQDSQRHGQQNSGGNPVLG